MKFNIIKVRIKRSQNETISEINVFLHKKRALDQRFGKSIKSNESTALS